MVIIFPCRICLKPVANNHQATKCDKCSFWIHIKCNKINKQISIPIYKKTSLSGSACHVLKNFNPSQTLMMRNLCKIIGKQIKFTHIDKVPKSVKENFNQKTTSETDISKYFTMSDLQSLTYNKKSDLALIHLNINTLQFHFDELESFLANCPIDFQILGIYL